MLASSHDHSKYKQGNMDVQKVNKLPPDVHYLLEESLKDGFNFVRRLIDDYESGTNRFNKSGEALFTLTENGKCIGIGGINIDPGASDNEIGRIRRVYIMKSFRGEGAGRILIAALEDWAAEQFSELRLYTDTKEAAAFYDRLGYKRSIHKGASHFKLLGS